MYGRNQSAEGRTRADMLAYRRGQTKAWGWYAFEKLLKDLGWKIEGTEAPAKVIVGDSYSFGEKFSNAFNFGVENLRGAFESTMSGRAPWCELKPSRKDPTLLTFATETQNVAQYVADRMLTSALNPKYLVTDLKVEPRKDPKKWLNWQVSFRMTVIGPAQRVTAPDGAARTLAMLPFVGEKRVQYDVEGLKEWMDEHGAMQTILAQLGVAEYKPGVGLDPRTLENTGTCPVCFGNFKLTGGKTMVLHGYERPQWGYVVGSCWGVRHKPVELATSGMEAWLGVLKERLKQAKEHQRRLKAGEVKEFRRETGHGADKRIEAITPGSPHWDWALSEALRRAKYDVEKGEVEVAFYTTAIEQWKGPYPEPTTPFPPRYLWRISGATGRMQQGE